MLRRLAEAGCLEKEIAAISGHKSTVEVARYTRAADQKLMAERAIARTLTTPQRYFALPTGEKGLNFPPLMTVLEYALNPAATAAPSASRART